MRSTVALSLTLLLVTLFAGALRAAEFEANFDQTPDRVWLGAGFWANPMEDFAIKDGRIECQGGGNRNVALLTRELTGGGFVMSATVGRLKGASQAGAVGFRIGLTDEIPDYRAAALRGKGLNVGIYNRTGALFIGNQTGGKLPDAALLDRGVTLTLAGKPSGGQVTLTLTATDGAGKQLAQATATAPVANIRGLVALVNNHSSRDKPAFWFDDFRFTGDGASAHDDRAWGPVLWTMHTLHQSLTADGAVLKLTAQLPPMGASDPKQAELWASHDGQWLQVAQAPVDPLACTAIFRVPNWDAAVETPYRVTYGDASYEGVIRQEPTDRPLVVAGFTGNTDYLFPNRLVARNVAIHNPDMLFFSGDQLYESVGGYGIVRAPTDTADDDRIRRASINYLRKWYLLGWAFGDLMRDRPTICLPDDHDVYQGNIWGEGGLNPSGIRNHAKGGFAEHPTFVNMVIRTQCGHHPDLPDPAPMKQNINVFFGDMRYGRVSFAMIEDRYFKSGPQGKVNTWKGRPDHMKDPNFDVSKLDQPGLQLLGDRQERFLETWATDYRGVDFKCLLSQTIFHNLANYHGPRREFIFADLDSNAWPQTPRNRTLKILRRGHVFHYAGDQHLPSITRYGVDTWDDAGFAFCVPSIAAGYPRSWLPDMEGRPVRNRPAPGLPNTGQYRDGFRHPVTVYAIGNPADKNRPGRENTGHDKSSGHGIVRFNHHDLTITIECYRLQFDANKPKPGDQFTGWPKTIRLRDNGQSAVAGRLDPVTAPAGVQRPILKVTRDGQLIYAIRLNQTTVQPWVFKPGKYTVELGESDMWTRAERTLTAGN